MIDRFQDQNSGRNICRLELIPLLAIVRLRLARTDRGDTWTVQIWKYLHQKGTLFNDPMIKSFFYVVTILYKWNMYAMHMANRHSKVGRRWCLDILKLDFVVDLLLVFEFDWIVLYWLIFKNLNTNQGLIERRLRLPIGQTEPRVGVRLLSFGFHVSTLLADLIKCGIGSEFEWIFRFVNDIVGVRKIIGLKLPRQNYNANRSHLRSTPATSVQRDQYTSFAGLGNQNLNKIVQFGPWSDQKLKLSGSKFYSVYETTDTNHWIIDKGIALTLKFVSVCVLK
jgi:hypothetical protein